MRHSTITARKTALGAMASLLVWCGGCDRGAKQQEPLQLRGEPIRPVSPGPWASDPYTPGQPEQTASVSMVQADVGRTQTVSTAAAPDLPPAPPPPVAATPSEPPAEADADGFLSLGFDVLSGYAIDIPDEMLSAPLASVTNAMDPAELIPENVRKLNDRQVSLQGFMLPLKVEGGLVTELLLMKDQSMCCFGTVPRINEWVSVRMNERGVKPVMDVPVTLHGTLHVGAMLDNGYLVGIYSMDGQRMTELLEE